jgi:hypothetical protein
LFHFVSFLMAMWKMDRCTSGFLLLILTKIGLGIG